MVLMSTMLGLASQGIMFHRMYALPEVNFYSGKIDRACHIDRKLLTFTQEISGKACRMVWALSEYQNETLIVGYKLDWVWINS